MKRWCCLTLVLVGMLAIGVRAEGADDDASLNATPTSKASLVSEREAAAIAAFRQINPTTQFYLTGTRITRVYGVAFEFGDNPIDTAQRFVDGSAEIFGVAAADLAPITPILEAGNTLGLMHNRETGQYKFTLVYYSQFRDGIPVFESEVRLLVRNEPSYPLVSASANLRRLGDFQVDQALVSAAFDPAQVAPEMVNFTVPETVIWAGVEDMEVDPVLAVKFIGDNYGSSTAQKPEKWLYLCDAATGAVLYKRNMIIFTDVTGNVSGMATTGPKSDNCGPEELLAMPYAKATIGATTAYADVNGNFTIPNAGTSQVTVQSPMSGLYFVVDNVAGAEETLSLNVTPPGPANFTHNAANTSELIRAQVNGYIQANVVRDWILFYHPTYPTIAGQTNFPVNVNRTDGYCPGNAWYDWYTSINFCQAASGYPNTAWNSVIYHEYGHHVVQTGGSGQDQYGEGMSDCVSVLILDDSHLGYGFFGDCNGWLRNAVNTYQYPCSGGSHDCGNLISGCVWDTRTQLAATNPATYRDIIGDLTVNSVPMHTGSTITPQITIDFLTLDDTDGNIYNGTPHYTEICAGFGAHNMDCPALAVGMSVSPTSGFTSTGQIGGPFTPSSQIYTLENLGPTAPISYTATGSASWLTITNGAGTLPSVGSTAQVTLSINANANALPEGDYTDTVYFTNTTNGVGNTTRLVTLRVGINDLCANARTACPGTVYTGSTQGMGVDGSTNCGTANSTPDVWYKYTPGSSGSATFTLCPTGGGTTYDSVMSLHSACPGTSGNTLNCDDDYCGGGGPSQFTRSVTAGTTYYIRVSGWSGSVGNYALEILGPACAATDTTPPTPNPMTFSSAPAPAGTTSISMQASLATDATSPPVQYEFDFTAGGAGGTDSGWQASRDYTDTGLSPNASYTYRVRARDSATTPNNTGYSGEFAAVTLANTPSAPTLASPTNYTMTLDVNPNGNPASTEFAVQCTASNPNDAAWSGQYVDATGNPSATAVWRTDAVWATTTVQGLERCTNYTFAVKARNSNNVETAFGPGASLSTAGQSGDMDVDGDVDGGDIAAFVDCYLNGGSGCGCANLSISAFVNCLLDAGMCP